MITYFMETLYDIEEKKFYMKDHCENLDVPMDNFYPC